MSKWHIVGNHMSRLIFFPVTIFKGHVAASYLMLWRQQIQKNDQLIKLLQRIFLQIRNYLPVHLCYGYRSYITIITELSGNEPIK